VDRAETELVFTRSAAAEYNRFRAFTPSPGAFLQTNLGRLRLQKLALAAESGEPGTVLSVRPLTVAFADGALVLDEVQPEGKKKQSGRDFANGARLAPGMRLHS